MAPRTENPEIWGGKVAKSLDNGIDSRISDQRSSYALIGFSPRPVSRPGHLLHNWATKRGNSYAVTLGGPKCAAIDLILIGDIFTRSENGKPHLGDYKRRIEPTYEEAAVPQNMGRWAIGIGKLSGVLIPNQEMASAFSGEFCEASKRGPTYAPFSAPMLRWRWGGVWGGGATPPPPRNRA